MRRKFSAWSREVKARLDTIPLAGVGLEDGTSSSGKIRFGSTVGLALDHAVLNFVADP